MYPYLSWSSLVLPDLEVLERRVTENVEIAMGFPSARPVFVCAGVARTRRAIMTMVFMGSIPRLLSLVVMTVLLTVPLGGCGSVLPSAGLADVGRRPPGFSEVYPYADGIEVQVTEVWTGRRLGVAVVDLTVIVRNGTARAFEAWMRGELRYGRYRLPAVRYLIPPGPDDSGSVQLIPIGGESDPYRLSFILPAGSRDDVVFTVAVDPGTHDPAVFVGVL